jgi:hypothetical protein
MCALAVLSSIVKPGYFFGFYFWLDAIATASLFFEVGNCFSKTRKAVIFLRL